MNDCGSDNRPMFCWMKAKVSSLCISISFTRAAICSIFWARFPLLNLQSILYLPVWLAPPIGPAFVMMRPVQEESCKAYFKRRVVARIILVRQVIFIIDGPLPLPCVHIDGSIPHQSKEILRVVQNGSNRYGYRRHSAQSAARFRQAASPAPPRLRPHTVQNTCIQPPHSSQSAHAETRQGLPCLPDTSVDFLLTYIVSVQNQWIKWLIQRAFSSQYKDTK